MWKISKCKGACEMLLVREISWEVLEWVNAFTLWFFYNRDRHPPPIPAFSLDLPRLIL